MEEQSAVEVQAQFSLKTKASEMCQVPSSALTNVLPENETNKSLTDIKTDEQSAVEIYTKTETGFACQHPVSRLYQNPYDCVYQCPSDYVYKCTVGYSYQGPTDYSHQSSAGYTYQGPADYAHQSTVLYAYEGPTSYPQQNTAGYAYLGPATFGPQTVGYTYQGPADYTQHSKVGYNYGGPASYIYQDPATYAHPNMVGYSYQDPANYAQQSTVVYAYQGAANYGHQSTTGSTYRHVPFNSYRGHSSNAYRGPTYTNYRRPSYTNYRHQNHNNYRHPAFNNYRHKGYNNYRCPPYTINYRHPIYSNYGCPTFNKFRGAAYSQYKDTAYNQYPKKYVWKNNAHDVSGNTKTNVSQAAAKTGNQSAITESSNEKTNMITMLREKIAMLDLKAESDRKKEAENWLGNVEKSVDHEPATPMVQQGQETSHCAVVQMHEDLDKQRHEWHQGKSFLVESLRNAKQGLDNRDREITTSRDELMEKLITLDNQAEETEDAQRKPKKRAVKKLFLQLLRKTGGT